MSFMSRVSSHRRSAARRVVGYCMLSLLLFYWAMAAICLYGENIKALFSKPAAKPMSDIASLRSTEETTTTSLDAGRGERAPFTGQ